MPGQVIDPIGSDNLESDVSSNRMARTDTVSFDQEGTRIPTMNDAPARRRGPIGDAVRTAENAQSSGDWDGALRHWVVVRHHIPGHEIGVLGVASALRELGRHRESDAILSEAMPRLPQSAGIAIGYALNAHNTHNWPEALRRWTDVRARFPDHPYAYAASASVLLALGQLDEADALLADAANVFPDDIDVAFHFANTAVARGDLAAAVRRWMKLESRFPQHPIVQSQALRPIAAALAADPIADDDSTLLMAQAADNLSDWPEAVRLWRVLSARDPASGSVRLRLGRALRESGNFDEADIILSAAVRFLPNSLEVATNYALTANVREDWQEAARRWRAVLTRFPDSAPIIGHVAVAFRGARHFSEGDMILQRAIESSPDQRDLRFHYALNAEAAEDWPEAARRWDEAHRLWPDDEHIQYARGTAIWHADITNGINNGSPSPSTTALATSPAIASPDRPDAISRADDDLRSLALGFEGLGDDCEFGIVQRRAGAEPIGLFRFAGAGGPQNLIYLLDSGFEALGEEEFTRLMRLDNGEYGVEDARGYYMMHTFIRADSVDANVLLQQQIRRINYLKQKLIEDLTVAEKIFVYKSTFSRLTNEELFGLHRAIRRYGAGTLLGIHMQEKDRPAGMVEVLADGLTVGYLDMMVHSDVAKGLSLDAWFKLLRGARYIMATSRGANAQPDEAEAR